MATRQTTLFACMLSAVFSAGAHDAPLPDTCAAGTRQITIASFQLTETALLLERQQHSPSTCPLSDGYQQRKPGTLRDAAPLRDTAAVRDAANQREADASRGARQAAGVSTLPRNPVGPTARCGVVDDYHVATMAIMKYCNRPEIGNGRASFRVTRPGEYTDKSHHALYSLGAGDLVGTCFVCVPRTPLKGTPIRPGIVKPTD